MPLGDPYVISAVDASAIGYTTKTFEIAHGEGEVYSSTPPARKLDIALQAEQVGGGNSAAVRASP
jgi:hypothetical protein